MLLAALLGLLASGPPVDVGDAADSNVDDWVGKDVPDRTDLSAAGPGRKEG